MDPWRAVALLCCALLSLSCCEAAGHLRAGAALRAPAVGGGDAGERQLAAAAVSEVLEGLGETLMEDHFDSGEHYMHNIVVTDDGQRVVVAGLHKKVNCKGITMKREWRRCVETPMAAPCTSVRDGDDLLIVVFVQLDGRRVRVRVREQTASERSERDRKGKKSNGVPKKYVYRGRVRVRSHSLIMSCALWRPPRCRWRVVAAADDDVETSSGGGRHLQQLANLQAPNAVLILRVGFVSSTGASVWPSCDDACLLVRACVECVVIVAGSHTFDCTSPLAAQDAFFTAPRSFAAQFLDSSGGFTLRPPGVGGSLIRSVQIGVSVAVASCDASGWGDAAVAAAGVDISLYPFR
jgi:hypothetical protein